MPTSTVVILVIFVVMFAIGAGNSVHARAKKILKAKGYAVDVFWARPIRDLRYFHHLVVHESDPVARTGYLRLQYLLWAILAVYILLLAAFMSLGVYATTLRIH